MPRPIRAEISRDALVANLARARRAAPSSRVWSVLKAEAYGHGLELVADALAADTDGFAVIDLADAVRLREAGHRHPILLLEGVFEPVDLDIVEAYGLTTVVHQPEQAAMLAARSVRQPIDVHVKLDTGMSRLGFPLGQTQDAVARLRSLAQVGRITLMTHFADADGPSGVAWQMARFELATAGLGLPRTLANSAAILGHPETQGDWIRPGILLYGGSPGGSVAAADLGLMPAMRLLSRLIAVREIVAGDSVGYGRRFVAPHDMRIGVVACGYADGYPRTAPNGTPVAVAGRRCALVGRVSMDMLTVDLTPVPQADVGTPVELWGAVVPVDEVAALVGTVGYELLTKVTRRVQRVASGTASV